MTTELSSAFIRTTEAIYSRNRIINTLYLPANLANLDQHSFYSSNLSELVVNVTKIQERGFFRARSVSREKHGDRSTEIRNQDNRNRRWDRGNRYTDRSPGMSNGSRDSN